MNSKTRCISTTLVILALLALGPAAGFATAQNLPSGYIVTDVMVPTRDGVRLNTKIIAPDNSDEPLPIILLRTPYGIEGSEDNFVTRLKTLADEGYIDANAGELLRYRKQLNADDIAVFTDIKKKHSSHSLTSDIDIVATKGRKKKGIAKSGGKSERDSILLNRTLLSPPHHHPGHAAGESSTAELPITALLSPMFRSV